MLAPNIRPVGLFTESGKTSLFGKNTKKLFGVYCCHKCAEKDCWGPAFEHGRSIRYVKVAT